MKWLAPRQDIDPNHTMMLPDKCQNKGWLASVFAVSHQESASLLLAHFQSNPTSATM
jgi:hypothetical protein